MFLPPFHQIVISRETSWPLAPSYQFGTYPDTPLPGLSKFYYLAQLGFWFHQLVVINLEERRKDHWQMFTHHIITIALVISSYYTNFTKVGTVILVLMDFCDILLPLAKMFRYLSLPTLTDTTFVLFLIAWFFTRQIGCFLVFLSVTFRTLQIVPHGWVPEEGNYVTTRGIRMFSILLGGLQIMNGVWFYMACNVAYRVVKGLGAEDTRSDDEG